MTDSPYTVARPSEGAGKTKETVTFWAELWRPMEKNSHGESLVSPKFGTQPECVAWVRARREKFDQVGMWKRISRAGTDYEDIPLNTDEAPLPDKERLHALIVDLKKMIDEKKRDLDKTGLGRRSQGLPRPAQTMDPLAVRQLAYDEVYDDRGQVRPEIVEGWRA